MIYCSNCGARVTRKVPEGDDRSRYVCESCTTVHYTNPKIVAGCIPVWQGRLLLCRRAIEPRHGLWTLPAGFMEDGESTEQAAARETWEEARARVENLALYGVFSILDFGFAIDEFEYTVEADCDVLGASPGLEQDPNLIGSTPL